jgi:uncharacterized protein YbbK (DUF523 family)
MHDYPRPVVVISRCIDFDSCRYDGQVIRASLREELEPHVELRPTCPELEIGLGVPRDPVRLVREQGAVRMLQPSTGRDLTRSMERFSARFLGDVGDVDGFILKARSPSCGVRDTKLFHSRAEETGHDGGAGLFAARVLERFPHAAVEDELRLTDPRLRDHFLTRLFTFASFREAASAGELARFHARHESLLMSYDRARLATLRGLVTRAGDVAGDRLVRSYRAQLAAALARPLRPGAKLNSPHPYPPPLRRF